MLGQLRKASPTRSIREEGFQDNAIYPGLNLIGVSMQTSARFM